MIQRDERNVLMVREKDYCECTNMYVMFASTSTITKSNDKSFFPIQSNPHTNLSSPLLSPMSPPEVSITFAGHLRRLPLLPRITSAAHSSGLIAGISPRLRRSWRRRTAFGEPCIALIHCRVGVGASCLEGGKRGWVVLGVHRSVVIDGIAAAVVGIVVIVRVGRIETLL
jgi:hypothetical protein